MGEQSIHLSWLIEEGGLLLNASNPQLLPEAVLD